MGNRYISRRIYGWATRPLRINIPIYTTWHIGSMIWCTRYWADLANVSLRRNLINNNRRAWLDLLTRTVNIQLQNGPDVCIWILQSNGQFSVKSMYATLMDETVLPIIQPLWKLKIPLKIKVFIWLLHRGVILTKDNLARRNWKGSMLCCYCSDKENIAHLFFNCSSASLLWRIIHTTFGLSRPNNVNHMFGSWLCGLTKSCKSLVYTGIVALYWTIWRSRNDIVFQKTKNQTSL